MCEHHGAKVSLERLTFSSFFICDTCVAADASISSGSSGSTNCSNEPNCSNSSCVRFKVCSKALKGLGLDIRTVLSLACGVLLCEVLVVCVFLVTFRRLLACYRIRDILNKDGRVM